jgi:CheY-like chemotaxis protein
MEEISLEALVEALRSERDAARHANRAKDRFLAYVSHELRTPMNGVLGMTRLALGTNLNEEQREYLEVIWSSAESLLTLINDLLDHAKIESGNLVIESIPFNLREVVASTVRSLAPTALEKGITLEHRVDAELPNQLVGDPTRLRQVLLNLAGNAVKFTDAGGVTIIVAPVAEEADETTIRFSVVDTGIGIPGDRLAMIFRAYEQADASTTRLFGGTGLGLSISQKIVELMHGRIWVESEVGAGSTFHFEITLGRVAESSQDPDTKRAHGHIRILTVTDIASQRSSIAADLEPHEVTVIDDIDSAGESLAAAREQKTPFHIVLLDLQDEGITIAERLMSQDGYSPDTRVILRLPSGQRGDAARCRELGIAGYLTGSVLPDELKETVVAVVANTPELITRHWLRERHRPLRILVADDSATNRLLALRLFEQRGHTVLQAKDGAEAVRIATTEDIDVILMDIHMPELDGISASRQIRKLPDARGEVPIVALTGTAGNEEKGNCLDAGMNGFVTKPYKVEDLFAIVADLTRRIETDA